MISETDIGEYEIIKGGVLGTGAFATVWKGRSKKVWEFSSYFFLYEFHLHVYVWRGHICESLRIVVGAVSCLSKMLLDLISDSHGFGGGMIY